jgi:hypothetical protein
VGQATDAAINETGLLGSSIQYTHLHLLLC